jgi:tetratricopeptide (TPR) repeat protein
MQLKLEEALERARKFILLGKLEEAEALVHAILKVRPKHKIALKHLETIGAKRVLPVDQRSALLQTFNAGNLDGAIAQSLALQKQFPKTALLYTIQGAAHAQQGDPERAESAFRKSIAIDPNSAQGFNNLGNSLREQGRLAEARKTYLKAVSLNPRFAQALGNLGVVLKEMQKYPQAISRFNQAIEVDANYTEAYRNLGVLHQECDAHSDAITAFKSCLNVAPNDIEAMSYLAGSYRASDNYYAAIPILQTILKHAPNRWKDRQSLGLSLVEVGDYAQGVAALEQVVKERPKDIVSLIHYSFALGKIKDTEKAEQVLRQVLDIDPDNLGALNNLGVLFKNRGDYVTAAEIFDQALLIDPTSSELRMNRSVIHFLQCEFKQAWPLYQARFEHENKSTEFLASTKPVWTGEKTRVFAWAEQGVGDEIFFASLLNDARDSCSELIVSVDKRLLDMFQRSFTGIRFVKRNANVSETEYDAHIPLGGLAGVLRNSLESFSAQPFGFLKPNDENIDAYKQWLGPFSGKTIGIAWSTTNRRNNHVRNVDLELLVNAFKDENVRLVNLQYGDTVGEITQTSQKLGVDVLTHPTLDRFNDIDGLGTLMCACDSVVTIDNSTVHLAAALGVDTHLILPHFPDWRWSYVDQGSPWYPQLNVYRQNAEFDWTALLNEVVRKVIPGIFWKKN